MLHQINPYNEEQFKEEFSQIDIFKQFVVKLKLNEDLKKIIICS